MITILQTDSCVLLKISSKDNICNIIELKLVFHSLLYLSIEIGKKRDF